MEDVVKRLAAEATLAARNADAVARAVAGLVLPGDATRAILANFREMNANMRMLLDQLESPEFVRAFGRRRGDGEVE